MRRLVKLLLLTLLIGLLVLVRYYEAVLFYDPFMAFFEDAIPGPYLVRWYVNVFLRFSLTSLISLVILWIIFRSREVIEFSCILYLVLFLILFPAFVYLMGKVDYEDYLGVFYIRRFLVHPLLLLLLLPAFYYQQMKG